MRCDATQSTAFGSRALCSKFDGANMATKSDATENEAPAILTIDLCFSNLQQYLSQTQNVNRKTTERIIFQTTNFDENQNFANSHHYNHNWPSNETKCFE